MKPMLVRACLLAGACLSSPALAQDADPAAPPEASAAGEDNVIFITGTRIRRPELDLPNPVVTVTAESIAQSGQTSLADLLVSSPALAGSRTGGLTGGSQTDYGEAGLDLLNLRNLGTDRTLVLVDGRRHVSGLAGSAAVDINAIPTDLVEAIDVLTGGASAIYGADGVSGVVNFRMKQDFEGLTARGQVGQSEHGGGDNYYGALTWGVNFAEGRGNFAVAYEYNKDTRLDSLQRRFSRAPTAGGLYRNHFDVTHPDGDDPAIPDYAPYFDVRWANSAQMGAVDVDWDDYADFEGDGDPYDLGMILEGGGGVTVGGSGTPVDLYNGDLSPGLERHLGAFLAHYDFSDAFTVFAEGKYVRSETHTLSQPTFEIQLFQSVENPFMPQVIRDAVVPGYAAWYWEDDTLGDGVGVTRDNLDLGYITEDTARDTWRGVVGARGELSDHVRYEVSYVYGRTESTTVMRNDRLTAQWLAATDVVEDPLTGDPVCRSSLDPDAPPELAGCRPFNVFGEGLNDAATIDFFTQDSLNRSTVSQHVVSGSLSGDFGSLLELPGGPIGYAVGAEYREEASHFTPDPALEQGLTWLETFLPAHGSFDVAEAFAEIALPILRDAPGAHLLSLGGAVRLSDYSTIGGTTTWKVDGVWAPVPDIQFRGTWSQAVRAPNIAELFAPGTTSYNFITDPCDVQELNNGSSTRAANCAALLTPLGVDPDDFRPSDNIVSTLFTLGTVTGNPDLSEESAKTWTLGLVLRPSFLPGFSATFDWYDIKIEDAVSTPEAQELAQLCVDQPSVANVYCDAIVRETGTGFITAFTAMPENVAQFRTAGLDFTLGYVHRSDSFGTFTVSLVGNYLDRLDFIATPGAELDSDVGEIYAPRWSATLDATWENGPWTVAYGLNWSDKTRRFTLEELAGDPDAADPRYLWIKQKWEHNIQLGYDVDERFNVYAGVNNFTDQEPDIGMIFYPVDALGRYFYAGVTVTLGKFP